MNKQKVSILALIVAFALCMAAMCAALMVSLNAGAEANVSSSSVFTTSGGASKKDGSEGEYLTYELSGSDSQVTLRKNLALKWYTFADEENKTVGDAGQAKYFSLTLAFADAQFDSFTVALETTQMSMSKDGKTTNELVFTPEGDALKVTVNGKDSGVTVAKASDVTISLSEKAGEEGLGDFAVSVKSGDAAAQEAGTFTNIGMNYAKYASATADTPVTPLTFKAETEEAVSFSIKELNGQSFVLNASDQITDNAAPVLVINSDIKQYAMGSEVSFDYVAIDVCSSSNTTTRYYLAEGFPVKDEDESEITAEFEDGDLVGYNDLASDKWFEESDFGGNAQGGKVSIAYKLTDGNSNSAYYFIEWYKSDKTEPLIEIVHPDAIDAKPVMEFVGYSDNGSGIVLDTETYKQNVTDFAAAVEAASKKAGESIQVGEGAYYYIPSLKAYVKDSSCGYTDMSFTVYYRSTSSDTQTVTGDYDELRIPVNKEGSYQFRVVVTNKSGNAMTGVFGDEGNYREADISSSNVWDAKNLVTFGFTVTYNGAFIEEPEDEETGYVDATYSISDFEIVALSGYKTEYKLYRFEANSGVTVNSSEELKNAEKAGTVDELGKWVEINVYDETLAEDDDANDNAYEWNPTSSLSFVPQEKGYYKVTVEVDDQTGKTQNEDGSLPSAFKIISVSAEADVIPGATYWLQNNILSVVFLGIGVLCLIAIVVLLVIKPKDAAALEAEKARKAELKEKRENRK